MTKNIRTQTGKIIGKTLNSYYSKVKPKIDELKFKEQYQGRIIDCMVGEVDDNYIETPETDSAIVKLEHSKEGLVKVPGIKGKTILVDSDGNETDTPAEGCRLVSVGEEEDNKLIILSKNKNLFDGELELGSISTSHGGNISHTECLRSKNYIKVRPNTTIIQSNDLGYASVVNVYDKDKNLIAYLGSKNPFTIPENGEYIRFRSSTSTSQNNLNVKYQFEEGNKATNYVEPKHHKTEILLNKPLRSLPNGVCDEIVGNKIIRRVGKMSFSDLNKIKEPTTIVWGTGNSHGAYQWEDMASFNGTGSNIINYKHRDNKITPNIVNNLYPYDTSWHGGNLNGSPQGLPSVFFGISNDGHIRLMVSKSLINPTEPSTVGDTEFKTWVENNLNLDAEFIYELEEPIIEELPNGITLQGFDDTTMYIENSITPTVSYGYNALIPYKEELSKQKEEVETNTLDIENNIIPYLMDMEYNLMLMEDN